MTDVRLGVIGAGHIARAVHLPTLRRLPGVAVTAIAEPAPAARAAAGRLVPEAVLVAEAGDLLGRADVDGVLVSAPSGLHAELAVATLRARKHLYLEKPIATDLAAAARVVDAGRDAGVVAMLGFNRRFHPLVLRLRELVGKGRLGEVRRATTSFSEPYAPERMPGWKRQRASGGGCLLDLALHHVDLLRFVLTTEVESVEATIRSRRTDDDEAELRLGLADGTAAVVRCSFLAARRDVVELDGARARVRLDRYAGTLRGAGRARSFSPRRLALRARCVLRPGSDPSYARALSAFVARIRGEPVAVPSLDDGLRSLEVVLAAEG